MFVLISLDRKAEDMMSVVCSIKSTSRIMHAATRADTTEAQHAKICEGEPYLYELPTFISGSWLMYRKPCQNLTISNDTKREMGTR